MCPSTVSVDKLTGANDERSLAQVSIAFNWHSCLIAVQTSECRLYVWCVLCAHSFLVIPPCCNCVINFEILPGHFPKKSGTLYPRCPKLIVFLFVDWKVEPFYYWLTSWDGVYLVNGRINALNAGLVFSVLGSLHFSRVVSPFLHRPLNTFLPSFFFITDYMN